MSPATSSAGAVPPTVYVGMAGDLIHPGHVNLLHAARRLGPVRVGLLSDAAVASYKRRPLMAFEQRAAVVSSLATVDDVVLQDTLDVVPNLRRYRPAWFVHGDDWRTGVLEDVRATVVRTLAEWGGELVEPPYTHGVSSSAFAGHVRAPRVEGAARQRAFASAWRAGTRWRAVGAFDAASAAIADGARDAALWLGPTETSARSPRSWVGGEAFAAGELLWRLHELAATSERPLFADAGVAQTAAHFAWLVTALDGLGASLVTVRAPDAILREAVATRRRALLVAASLDASDLQRLDELERVLSCGVDAVFLRGRTNAWPQSAVRDVVRVAGSTPVLVELTPFDRRREEGAFEAGARAVVHPALLERAADAAMRAAVARLEDGSSPQGQLK